MKDAFADDALVGRTAFLAGASSGINLEIARQFARRGARVAMVSRSPEKIAAAAQSVVDAGGEALGLAADVRSMPAVEEALARTVDRFGPIDVVLSGAAGNFLAPALGLSSNAFRTVVEIDLIGSFHVLRAAFAHLRKPGASLISISAPLATNPALFQCHAAAAKAGVNMLTKCLAMEWGPAGVRVNAISPGPIADTEGMSRLAPTAEMEAAWKAGLALRDYGRKQDIADAAVFLASDASRYITGTIIECDGGSALGDARGDALSVQARA